MRTIRNLAWFLLACGLTVWAGIASAQVARDTYYRAGSNTANQSKDRVTACGYAAAAGGWVYQGVNATLTSCLGYKQGYGNNFAYAQIGTYTCPSTKPTFDENTRVCGDPVEPPPRCDVPKGTKFTFHLKIGTAATGGQMPAPGTDSPYPSSSDKCYLDSSPEVKNCYSYSIDSKTDQLACTFEGVSSGDPVSEGQGPGIALPPGEKPNRTDMPPTDAPDKGPCPAGTVNVGINSAGTPRCAGTGTDPKNKPPAPPKTETEVMQSSDDGTKTTTKTETVKNSDGSETVIKTVTVVKPDGTKSVDQDKTTSNNSAGKPGKDESDKDDEKYDLCKQNPNLTICKNSSVAGSCGEISCTGDAIQCATLRAAAAMQCKQQKDEEALIASPLRAVGQAAIDGADLASLPSPKNGQVVNIPTLDSQGWLGNGAGFTDITISLQGQQVLLPLSKVTEYLLPLRYVLMLVASLVSYRILAGAVLKE